MSINLKNPKYYFNRELSWLKFNERVLEEAEDNSHPLLERLKFLSIFSSNLDEFFMIRVAGLKEQIHAGVQDIAADGIPPEVLLDKICDNVHNMVERQSKILLEDVLPKLRKKAVRIRYYNTLPAHQKAYLKTYFKEKVFPVLTPMAVDPTHPFPQLKNLGLSLLVELRAPYQRGESQIAVIPVPIILNRLIALPGKQYHDFVLLEKLIEKHLDLLFPGMKISKVTTFRITRNADIDLSEAEADDLLKLIERELRKRRLGTVIRLEVSDKISSENREFLKQVTGLEEKDIYDIHGYLDLAPFITLLDVENNTLKDASFTPALNEQLTSSNHIFEAIRKGDVLLHHPYDSFNHVVELIQEAAEDPKVLAIKQTLYRTSGKSTIVKYLKRAVENGKQVTALIELKARFDEETNIGWAKELDRAGVNVVYGLLGLKTHCKLLMVVRQEKEGIQRYLHMSTGNYNAKTAKTYTDIGLLTCDQALGKDASELFNLLTGYSRQEEWRKMWVAPVNMRENLLRVIQACIRHHSKTSPSQLNMVMNSLVDPEMIRYLYKASMKGIKVNLVIRGICCLKPGIPGISENIHVRSIVGRFLEHTRIYHFEYGDEQKVYIGSADLMPRNLNRRVEVLFPIEREENRVRLIEIIQKMLMDTAKARVLDAKGNYTKVSNSSGKAPYNLQKDLLRQAHKRQVSVDTTKHLSAQ